MRKYYKAYYLKDLRQFNGWTEKQSENEPALSDDTICYLGDDFVVVSSPVQDKGAIFQDVTPAWQEFCATTLRFEIPEHIRAAAQENAKTVESAAV